MLALRKGSNSVRTIVRSPSLPAGEVGCPRSPIDVKLCRVSGLSRCSWNGRNWRAFLTVCIGAIHRQLLSGADVRSADLNDPLWSNPAMGTGRPEGPINRQSRANLRDPKADIRSSCLAGLSSNTDRPRRTTAFGTKPSFPAHHLNDGFRRERTLQLARMPSSIDWGWAESGQSAPDRHRFGSRHIWMDMCDGLLLREEAVRQRELTWRLKLTIHRPRE